MKVPAARVVFDDAQRAEIAGFVDEALRTGALTLGPRTRAFEDAFAARHGTRFAVATGSGTSALEIVLRSLWEGDPRARTGEVIVPANTFYATAAAVLHAGGDVRLADIDPATLSVSVDTLDAALTPLTVGVIHVHIAGIVSPAIAAIAAWCRERDLWLVEDAAHAHGSSYAGTSAGAFGRAAAFSFYPTKVVTSAEGGMITTDDARLFEDAVIHRDQGKAGFQGGDHVRLGSAWRMSEVHAAIGLVHFGALDRAIARRNAVAARYDNALDSIPGIRAIRPPVGGVCNYYKYVTLLDPGIERDEVKRRMARRGVTASGEVYAKPLHHHPVLAFLTRDSLQVAEDVCKRQLCLPIHSDMTDDEANAVIDAVVEAVSACRN
jgi:perosamine synthetase